MSTRSEKAEKILRKMKAQGRRPVKPYDGPPEMNFISQKTTEATQDRILEEFNQSTLDKVGKFTTSSGITHWRFMQSP